MQVSKEFKEALFDQLSEYKVKAKKKYSCSYKEKLITDLRESYISKMNEYRVKCAEEAIKKVEQTYNYKFKEENLAKIKETLLNEYYYSLPAYCYSEEDVKNSVFIDKIDSEVKKEKQNLIIKLPFLKKEEELWEYMKGIEDRLNAI